MHNVIIIGSGPSGYTATIYTSRAALSPLLFAGETFGGQLMSTTKIENFPGFGEGIHGPQLMQEMRTQAQKFGSTIIDADVEKVDFSSRPFKIWSKGEEYQTKSVIISTGAKPISLKLPGEERYYGRGLSMCATCDGAFFRDKIVYVVGGGDSALEESQFLTRFASQVNLVVRRDQLRASKVMQETIFNNSKIKVFWNTELVGLRGEGKLEKLTLLNNKTNEKKEVEADGLFYAIGHSPTTSLFKDQVKTNENGYILTSINGLITKQSLAQVWERVYPTMTSVDGVFAAGDVVDFRYQQAVVAAGMGAMAALDVEKWLEENNQD